MLLRKLVTPFSMSSTPASHVQWSAGFALRGARPEAVRDKSPTTLLAGTFSLTPFVGVLRQEGSGNPHSALCPGLKPNRVGGLTECFGRLAWAELQLVRCGDDESED